MPPHKISPFITYVYAVNFIDSCRTCVRVGIIILMYNVADRVDDAMCQRERDSSIKGLSQTSCNIQRTQRRTSEEFEEPSKQTNID